MLEDLAWGYLSHSEMQMKLFAMGWLVLGGIGAVLFHGGSAVLRRAPYFALSGFVILAIAFSQLVYLPAGQAMQGGWLFAVVGSDIALTLLWGYALVALGKARSRDVLGHGRAAIASLVPIANLWLTFAPSAEAGPEANSNSGLRAGLLVAVGLAAIIGSRMVEARFLPMIEAGVMAVADDPNLTDRFVEQQLAIFTPEEVLRDIADQTQVPQIFDKTVSLMKVTAEGRVLTYVYHLLEPGAEVDATLIEETRFTICGDPLLVRLLDRGARVDFVYFSKDSSGAFAELGQFSATAQNCRI